MIATKTQRKNGLRQLQTMSQARPFAEGLRHGRGLNFVFLSFRIFVIVFIAVEDLTNDNRKINGKSGWIRKMACLTPLI